MRVLSAPSSLAWAGNRPRTSIAAPCQRMGHRLRRRTRRGQSASEVANACDGQFLKKTRTKGSEKTETPRISREKNQLRISSYSSANYSPIAGKSIYRISLERSGISLATQARVRALGSNLGGSATLARARINSGGDSRRSCPHHLLAAFFRRRRAGGAPIGDHSLVLCN